jgi:hypothetical protein
MRASSDSIVIVLASTCFGPAVYINKPNLTRAVQGDSVRQVLQEAVMRLGVGGLAQLGFLVLFEIVHSVSLDG